jgi:disulfide oxidoreductase YuzD
MSGDGVVAVRVFGVPTAGTCGQQDGWRDATEWIARSLKAHFGEQIRVEYYDLFSAALDAFPNVMELVGQGEAQPPLVFVGDELFSSGGRISGPAIRRRLEILGLAEVK